MTTEPEHSLEVERTYDVDEATPLPDFTRLPGVASVGQPEVRELDARYFDTADTALGRARVALRRRTGGPDAGWHVKRSAPEGKYESRWPLDDAAEAIDETAVPAHLAAAVSDITPGPFALLARIRNTRTAYALRDGDGRLVAEFVDDRVTATAARRDTETGWREWELELGPAGPETADGIDSFFACADDLVRAAGGRPSASDSKLSRALGL